MIDWTCHINWVYWKNVKRMQNNIYLLIIYKPGKLDKKFCRPNPKRKKKRTEQAKVH